jgi:hypothetical protein
MTLRCVIDYYLFPNSDKPIANDNAFSASLLYSERDTTGQLIGPIDQVIQTVIDLVEGSIDWAGACARLPAYDGVQAVE